jgi:hypothetical protein
LKPAADPNFNRSNGNYESDPARDPANDDPIIPRDEDRSRLNRDDFAAPASRSPATRLDPAADSGAAGAGDSDPPMFGTDPVTDPGTQIRNKPPMSDVADPDPASTGAGDQPADSLNTPAAAGDTNPANPTSEGDGKTFLPDAADDATGAPQPQARVLAPTRLASQSSSLSEVLGSKRLASRSLPAVKLNPSGTQFAGRTNQNSTHATPVRWIGGPDADNRTRL